MLREGRRRCPGTSVSRDVRPGTPCKAYGLLGVAGNTHTISAFFPRRPRPGTALVTRLAQGQSLLNPRDTTLLGDTGLF